MKAKISKRAIEARIKTICKDENRKVKKKGDTYTVIDLDKGVIEKTFADFVEMADYLNAINSWEELDVKLSGVVSVSELALYASAAAMSKIDTALGIVLLDDGNHLLDEIYGCIFKLLTDVKNSGEYDKKSIKLLD